MNMSELGDLRIKSQGMFHTKVSVQCLPQTL